MPFRDACVRSAYAARRICARGGLAYAWIITILSLPKRWFTGAMLALSMTVSACDMAAVNNPYASRAVSTPVLVSGSRQHARVSAGFFPSCAMTTSGDSWCCRCKAFWSSRTPLRVAGALVFADIAVGVTFSCALIIGRARILLGWRISRSAFIAR